MGKAVAPTNAEIHAGAARGKARQRRSYAKKLVYRSDDNTIVLSMYSGAIISVPSKDINELRDATQNDLRQLRLTPGGGMIWSKSLDLHISVPGILRRILGLDWFERAGRTRSEAKAAAAKRNGQKGGRPRQPVVQPGGRFAKFASRYKVGRGSTKAETVKLVRELRDRDK